MLFQTLLALCVLLLITGLQPGAASPALNTRGPSFDEENFCKRSISYRLHDINPHASLERRESTISGRNVERGAFSLLPRALSVSSGGSGRGKGPKGGEGGPEGGGDSSNDASHKTAMFITPVGVGIITVAAFLFW